MRILRNIDYGDILPFGIINRIFRPALLTVEDGDHTASVVDCSGRAEIATAGREK